MTGIGSGRLYSTRGADRDSGVEWPGRIPQHWRVAQLKDHVRVVNGFPFDSEFFSRDRGLPLVRIRDLSDTETEILYDGPLVEDALIENGDIIVGMDGDFNVARWKGDKAFLNQRMCCLRVNDSLDAQFIFYLLPYPLRIINDLTYSTTVKHLSSVDVGRIRIGLPPIAEQRAIAAFLDRETAKLDALIAKKERLLALLDEKRTALIACAVTKGLDPTLPMKDSGVEWLGEVPTHWEIKRTKFVARLKTGHTPSRQHPEYWVDCTIPWFGLADVWQIRDGKAEYVTETSEKISELGLANSAADLLPKGTVILSRTASVGFSAIMGVDMATTQDFVNWIPGPPLRSKYLLYVFRAMTPEYRRLTMGSTHQTIYWPDVTRFMCPVPPLSEQDAIVGHIRERCAHLDALTGRIHEAIALLREYRTALISAAVTGQIDVSGVVDRGRGDGYEGLQSLISAHGPTVAPSSRLR